MSLREKPFYLNDDGIKWVKDTLKSMTLEDKIGQLFCVTGMPKDNNELANFIRKYKPAGFMFRPGAIDYIHNAYKTMQENSSIPMLFPSNLEAGGNGLLDEGTFFAKPLGVAATNETIQAKRLGLIAGREGGSMGCNWSFAPIIDIDFNWRNPITNLRTFGSNPDKVIAMAKAYIDGLRESNYPMASCIKHFPGDGVDERDHHLLPTVNSLSVEEWEASYGKVYKELIDYGARTVMVGHILQPAMTRKYAPNIKDEEIMPGSSNKYLVTDVLKKQLGFNGLVVTDATPMVGFSGTRTRREAIVNALNAGCDMILFCKNIDEDYASVREAIADGTLSIVRVDAAVEKSLALKASLGLHLTHGTDKILPPLSETKVVGSPEHKAWAIECADKSVTLVKDNQNLLPISPKKTKRIRLTVIGENNAGGAFGDFSGITMPLKEALEKAGFEVALYDYKTMENGEIFDSGVADMKAKFDLSIVAANVATGSNYTTRRIDWITFMAANEPWYTREIPTLFVSFANPYHMIDVAYISTIINCYSSNQETIEACVDKLVGKSEFKGTSPVDPSCGNVWGAKFM